MKQIEKELQDLRYLEWTKTRHSSGTAGSFLKSFENSRGKRIYYKLSNFDSIQGIVGHECINEILADRLLTILNIEHVPYRLIHAKIQIRGIEYETYLCASEDFKKKGESKIALDAFYDMEAEIGERPLDFCIRMGWGDYIWEMLTIDYLIQNRDRHGANIEVLRSKKEKTIRLAPLFDHGLSFVFSSYNDAMLEEARSMKESKIQCFVGTSSAKENLNLIPMDKLKKLPVFDEKIRQILFDGFEGIVTEKWMDIVWSQLTSRVKIYEDICNNR